MNTFRELLNESKGLFKYILKDKTMSKLLKEDEYGTLRFFKRETNKTASFSIEVTKSGGKAKALCNTRYRGESEFYNLFFDLDGNEVPEKIQKAILTHLKEFVKMMNGEKNKLEKNIPTYYYSKDSIQSV